ncbi:MAG: hypothetical protein ACREQ4_03530 [Candidatus Binataceae bacterium]
MKEPTTRPASYKVGNQWYQRVQLDGHWYTFPYTPAAPPLGTISQVVGQLGAVQHARHRYRHPGEHGPAEWLPSGRWLCSCGHRHRDYVTRCKCGAWAPPKSNGRELHE